MKIGRAKNEAGLIEVFMPLEQASILSPREKNVRSGATISTFHVWPARRPLAACRAALLAALLPDPGDATQRTELVRAIGGDVKVEKEESTDEEGNLVVEERPRVQSGVLAWNTEFVAQHNSASRAISEAWGSVAWRH